MPICRFSNPQGLGVSGPVAHLGEHRDQNTAGQRAIAAAEAWIHAEKEGKTLKRGGDRAKGMVHPEGVVKDAEGHFSKMFGVRGATVQHARALLRGDPDVAALVKAGKPLRPAPYAAGNR